MAWVESHQELARHPKTRKLARRLGIGVPCAIGHLHLLWWWALDFAQDGELTRYEAEEIAEAALWEGDAQTFRSALILAGFVDGDEEQEWLRLHDWAEYGGRLCEQRDRNREKQRSWRERNRADNHHRNRLSPQSDAIPESHNGDVTVTKPGSHLTTLQDTTQQDRREIPSGIFVGDASPPVSPSADAASSTHPRDPEPEPGSERGSEPERERGVSRPATLYAEDSEPMGLARMFAGRIRGHKPDARIPKNLQGWARECDLMLRVDHRGREQIEAVMAFATTDRFWRGVILSAGKLREKFDQLDIQREENARGTHGRGNGRYAGAARSGQQTRAPRPGSPEYYQRAAV